MQTRNPNFTLPKFQTFNTAVKQLNTAIAQSNHTNVAHAANVLLSEILKVVEKANQRELTIFTNILNETRNAVETPLTYQIAPYAQLISNLPHYQFSFKGILGAMVSFVGILLVGITFSSLGSLGRTLNFLIQASYQTNVSNLASNLSIDFSPFFLISVGITVLAMLSSSEQSNMKASFFDAAQTGLTALISGLGIIFITSGIKYAYNQFQSPVSSSMTMFKKAVLESQPHVQPDGPRPDRILDIFG